MLSSSSLRLADALVKLGPLDSILEDKDQRSHVANALLHLAQPFLTNITNTTNLQ